MQKKYRKCVGMMILNARNQILVGRRLDHPSGYWQMPQGGIDENENPWTINVCRACRSTNQTACTEN